MDMQRTLKFFPVQNDNPKVLTRKQIQHFNEFGNLFPIDIFSSEEMEVHRAYFDKLMARTEAQGLNSYSINGWHRHCRGLYDMCFEKRILDCMEDLLGPNLVLTMTHYFCKTPGDEKQVSWHQDASYWPLSPSKVITVWLAIDDVDEENSAMRYIPRSHLNGHIPFESSSAEEQNVLSQAVRDALDYGDEPVSVCMKAGQITLHSDMLLHGSDPNRSARRRCGLTLRYMPPDVRTQAPDHASAIIARGEDPSGYWQHIPRPDTDDVPEDRQKKNRN